VDGVEPITKTDVPKRKKIKMKKAADIFIIAVSVLVFTAPRLTPELKRARLRGV
jgi:hypothetical protein